MKNRPITIFLMLAVILFSLCACSTKPEGITQINTIDALLSGVYDGQVTLAELRRSGDFGIGTFDRLDGEMLLLDGMFYQIKSDGKAYRPDDTLTAPFAAVMPFQPDSEQGVTELSFGKFCAAMDKLAPRQNMFVAIRLTGTFRTMHTRSVPAQVKPYRPLLEVTQHQPEFQWQSVRGTVMGFRLPSYVKGINVPGYHLHFISDGRDKGGHILGFELESGKVEWQESNRFAMILDSSGAFAGADLSKDRSAELHQVEGRK